MNSKKIIKIIFSMFFALSCLFLFQTMSHAASFSASISKTTVTVGDTFTVTVKASNAAGMYSVSNSNSNVSLSSGSKSEFIENSSATIKFKATKAGKVTITAKAVDMTDLDNSDKAVTGTKTFNVTIKEKSSSGSSESGSSSTKPTFTSTNKKVYAKDSINLRSSWSTSSSATPVSKGTEMTLTGTSSKKVNGYVWYRVSYKGATKYVASSLVTTTKPEDKSDKEKEEEKDDSKATNTNLKSLTVTPTGLSPVFATGTTEYTMTVGSDVDKIDIKAIAEDANATVKISGNENLKIGTNKITITVKAGEDTKIYNINVTKEDKKQLQLSELLIEGLPLEPEFDSNVYEYTLTLDRSDVSELNITATPSKESAEVEIVGNTDLKPGENIVTILVKSEDGEDVSTYQITITIPEVTAVGEENNHKELYMYIGIGVGALLVLIIIIVIIKKRRNAHDEDYMYYGNYNPNGNDIDNEDEKIGKKKESTDADFDLNTDMDLDQLPKLQDEDLPKSLRKKEPVVSSAEVQSSDIKTEVKAEPMSERAKKIEEFYNAQDTMSTPRKRGKHSK